MTHCAYCITFIINMAVVLGSRLEYIMLLKSPSYYAFWQFFNFLSTYEIIIPKISFSDSCNCNCKCSVHKIIRLFVELFLILLTTKLLQFIIKIQDFNLHSDIQILIIWTLDLVHYQLFYLKYLTPSVLLEYLIRNFISVTIDQFI